MAQNEPHAMVPPSTARPSTPIAPVGGARPLRIDCDAAFRLADYDPLLLAAAVVLVVVGVAYAFFGYRLHKVVLFLTGFLFAGVVVHAICAKEQSLGALATAAVALGVALLFGMITVAVDYVGLFVVGFLSGLLLGIVALLAVHWAFVPASVWLTIALVFCCGLVMSLSSLRWQRCFLMVDSALLGAAILTVGLDYVAERALSIRWLWHAVNERRRVHAFDAGQLCWYGWLMLAVFPLVFVVGLLIQWRVTAVDLHHAAPTGRPKASQKRSGSAQRLKARSGEPHRQTTPRSEGCIAAAADDDTPPSSAHPQRSFRALYRARQTHGDVICQSYLESLRRTQQERTGTLSSDHTCFTVLSEAPTDEDGSRSANL